MNLNDKICYWKEHPEDDNMLRNMFMPDERDILDTIHKFEILRSDLERERGNQPEQDKTAVFAQVEKEERISFRLKELFLSRIDALLAEKQVKAWLEITIWYSLLVEKKLILDDFWEFPVLRIMIDIFVEELNAFLERGDLISILSLHSMKELTEAYFKTIFLCRRIEYGIEPMEEIRDYLKEKNFSFIFLQGIVHETQIFNKKKVMGEVGGWYRYDDG